MLNQVLFAKTAAYRQLRLPRVKIGEHLSKRPVTVSTWLGIKMTCRVQRPLLYSIFELF